MKVIIYADSLNGMLFYMIDHSIYYYNQANILDISLSIETKQLLKYRYGNVITFDNTLNKYDTVLCTYQTYNMIADIDIRKIILYSNKLHLYILKNKQLPLELQNETIYGDIFFLYKIESYPVYLLKTNFKQQRRIILKEFLKGQIEKIPVYLLRDYDFKIFPIEQQLIYYAQLYFIPHISLQQQIIKNMFDYKSYVYCLLRGFLIRSILEGFIMKQDIYIPKYISNECLPRYTTMYVNTYFRKIIDIDLSKNCIMV